MDFKKMAMDVEAYTIQLRREMHEHPCISHEEEWTSDLICRELDAMGIPYIRDGINNVVGTIKGGQDGKKIALRADIDALPMPEETGLEFSSKIEGKMHACGHDFHTANLIGVAKVLNSIKDDLKGTVYLCFQVGEERSFGALEIIDYLETQGGVDTVLAMHVMPEYDTGAICLKKGPFMAGCSLVEIEVTGRGGHGSMPWLSVDPCKAASEILLRLAGLTAYKFSAFDTVVINPCAIIGGTAANIIPDTAEVKLNVRFFYDEIYNKMVEEITKISNNIAESFDCTAKCTFSEIPSTPVVNDDDAVEFGEQVCDKYELVRTTMQNPLMGSDNYGEYVKKYGGQYVFGGITPKGDAIIPIHNSKFSPDEAAFKSFNAFFCAYTYEFLNG